ncbi:DNA-directed RNA polymerase sigma-70 factor [Catellatospora methionotrophica]|uniref:DNA-directed RNA polymerase sigma-70 factor n=1 Tax=Catellatospora methionotrophica TaxID=121620 RepID=A0A8J3PCR1_9ACTN|nr:RNA polymerase sigma factor [Catellatospora methionotrophica]GIG12691.1 DNA-directed RNA polymerase sigma-70 factor [Catellatospora methionotrophica]
MTNPLPPAADLTAEVQAARQGDEAAFNRLYHAVQPGLLRYLRLLVGADAEDVASETWLQIVRDLHTFRGDEGGFRRWAATVGRHRAMDHLRHHQRRPSVPMPVEAMVELPATDDTAASAEQLMTTGVALSLIASLPADQAEAVLLRAVLGLDARSAADVLGKRPGAVRMAAHRGLRRLAEVLGVERHGGVSVTPGADPTLNEVT